MNRFDTNNQNLLWTRRGRNERRMPPGILKRISWHAGRTGYALMGLETGVPTDFLTFSEISSPGHPVGNLKVVHHKIVGRIGLDINDRAVVNGFKAPDQECISPALL